MINIKNLKPNGRYTSGSYKAINQDKYIGDLNRIIYRSSYERAFCVFCDTTDAVIRWESEPFSIPYISGIDKRKHHYFVDFYARIKNPHDDKFVDYLIEVKPSGKLKKPTYQKVETHKRIASFNANVKEFIINMSKFVAAKEYARSIGYEFIIITEKHLFNK